LKASRDEEADMKLPHIAIILATAAALASPAPCAAQEPVTAFDQLNTRLKPGDTVWVTDAQGREAKGRIESLGPDALTLKGGHGRTFPSGDVRFITARGHDSLTNGAIIGAVPGVLMGLAMAGLDENNHGGDFVAIAVMFGGLGAAIGVGFDALVPGEKVVSYRAPGSASPSHARLSIAPVVTRRAKGVSVAFSF
jgi:hypothetical protein